MSVDGTVKTSIEDTVCSRHFTCDNLTVSVSHFFNQHSAVTVVSCVSHEDFLLVGAIGANQNIEVLQAQQRQLAEQLAQLQSQIVAAASVAISSQSVGRGGVAPVAPIAITAAAPISSTSVGVGQPTTAAVPTLPPTTMVGNGLNGTAAGVIMQQHQSAANASAAGTNLAASASGSDKGGYGPSAKGRGERASFRPY